MTLKSIETQLAGVPLAAASNALPTSRLPSVLLENKLLRGVSRRAFAKKLGMHASSITLIFKGQRGYSTDTLAKIANYLQTTIDHVYKMIKRIHYCREKERALGYWRKGDRSNARVKPKPKPKSVQHRVTAVDRVARTITYEVVTPSRKKPIPS